MRRRMGAAALEMDAASDGSAQAQWRATVAARLPSQRWPQQPMLIVAVDAHTGEPVVFDRHSGVELADAVAASCANGFGVPPYTIGERRYIDGGYRANENADLAAGYARVLVLSPLGGRSRHPSGWGTHLAAQADELRAGGSRVETIFPDSNSQDALGVGLNMMDPSSTPGRRQSRLRPRQSPCRATHRILALTPPKPVDSSRRRIRGLSIPGGARCPRWSPSRCAAAQIPRRFGPAAARRISS